MTEKCFISSISSDGYKNMLNENAFDDKKLFTINYMPEKNISYLIDKYSNLFAEKNLDIQIIFNPLNISPVGLIVPELNIGFVSFLPFEHNFFKDKTVYNNKYIIDAEQSLSRGYELLQEALDIHNEWEQVYIQHINFAVLNHLTNRLIHKIFDSSKIFSQHAGKSTSLFFGATSANGPKDFLGETIENFSVRYFIKGRPGSGKSTILKALANASLKTGYDVCMYHCSFDPKSIDMITIKALDLCIFDSTAPHEYFPSRNDDHVIDIYETAIGKEFDNRNQKVLDDIKNRYSQKIKQATAQLKNANINTEIFRESYSKSFSNVKMIKIEQVFSDILAQL